MNQDVQSHTVKISLVVYIIISLIPAIVGFSSLIYRIESVEKNQDVLIAGQKEMITEFKSWKTQAETRLGEVEKDSQSIAILLENHLGWKVIR